MAWRPAAVRLMLPMFELCCCQQQAAGGGVGIAVCIAGGSGYFPLRAAFGVDTVMLQQLAHVRPVGVLAGRLSATMFCTLFGPTYGVEQGCAVLFAETCYCGYPTNLCKHTVVALVN